jgi:predicted enzyme involved in methoxymalonyl-ACP biosynthesis
MKDFANLKRNLKKDASALKPIKVALLGDTATQFLTKAIQGAGYEYGYNLQLWEADFNQVERQVADPSSELHEYGAELIIIFNRPTNCWVNTTSLRVVTPLLLQTSSTASKPFMIPLLR